MPRNMRNLPFVNHGASNSPIAAGVNIIWMHGGLMCIIIEHPQKLRQVDCEHSVEMQWLVITRRHAIIAI